MSKTNPTDKVLIDFAVDGDLEEATAQLQQLVQKEMVKELRRVYYDQVQGDVMYDNSPYATDDEFDPFLEERIKELEQKGGVSE